VAPVIRNVQGLRPFWLGFVPKQRSAMIGRTVAGCAGFLFSTACRRCSLLTAEGFHHEACHRINPQCSDLSVCGSASGDCATRLGREGHTWRRLEKRLRLCIRTAEMLKLDKLQLDKLPVV
jgi:hypothetical protein